MAPKRFVKLLSSADAAVTTWLTIGALAQILSMSILPRTLGILLPVAYAIYHLVKVVNNSRLIYTGTFTSVKRGTWTAQLPVEGTNEPEEIVCFVLGARFNHPLGKAAPGVREIAGMMQEMWTDAEGNREEFGYLGRTSTLLDLSDDEALSMAWLSYWTDIDKLQKFADAAAHRLGQNSYLGKKFPYVGIMHETFKAPRGCWETVYLNMPPWGLGKARPVKKSDNHTTEIESTLHKVSRPEQRTMLRRMRGYV